MKTVEQIVVDEINKHINELSAEDQEACREMVYRMKITIKAAGTKGLLALALVGAEAQLENSSA